VLTNVLPTAVKQRTFQPQTAPCRWPTTSCVCQYSSQTSSANLKKKNKMSGLWGWLKWMHEQLGGAWKPLNSTWEMQEFSDTQYRCDKRTNTHARAHKHTYLHG
jgi:hypothetical protein